MDPETILRSLVDHQVAFVLIGGLAATAHGSSLATFDIDVCYRQDDANCSVLAQALKELGAEIFPIRTNRIEISPELLGRYPFINLKTSFGRLDVLAHVDGLGRYEDLIGETAEVELGDRSISVLTIEQLIAAKRAANRPKDREHLDHLLAIRDRGVERE